MVQGSPYVTNKYQDATPEIRALSIFSDVSCPFGADGNYKDGSGYDGRYLKWGVCTPYDPLSVSILSLPLTSERASVAHASFSLFSRAATTAPKN
jgi:hypothetical protein